MGQIDKSNQKLDLYLNQVGGYMPMCLHYVYRASLPDTARSKVSACKKDYNVRCGEISQSLLINFQVTVSPPTAVNCDLLTIDYRLYISF